MFKKGDIVRYHSASKVYNPLGQVVEVTGDNNLGEVLAARKLDSRKQQLTIDWFGHYPDIVEICDNRLPYTFGIKADITKCKEDHCFDSCCEERFLCISHRSKMKKNPATKSK